MRPNGLVVILNMVEAVTAGIAVVSSTGVVRVSFQAGYVISFAAFVFGVITLLL